jgi:hypothetical protein
VKQKNGVDLGGARGCGVLSEYVAFHFFSLFNENLQWVGFWLFAV